MIILSDTNDALQITRSSANAVDVYAAFVDHTSSAYTPDKSHNTYTSAASSSFVTSPAASTQRQVKYVSVRARGGANVITIAFLDTATAYELVEVSLSADDTLTYTDTDGWEVIDSSGQIKQVTTSGIAGHVLRDAGSGMTQRAAMNFVDTATISFTLTDDAGNNETEVSATYLGLAGHGIRDNGSLETQRGFLNFISTATANGITFTCTDDAGGNETEITAVVIAASDTLSGGIEIAIQSEQETGTDVVRAVTPGRQHFHPSAAKCWGFTTGAGTPALNAQSYNMTSITDTGVGILTVTIATDFSSASWIALAQQTQSAATTCMMVNSRTKAAGTVILDCDDNAGTAADPGVGYNWVFYGDL